MRERFPGALDRFLAGAVLKSELLYTHSADSDGDGDKDLSDVAAFQNCFGLSGGELEPACGHADWEDDGNVSEVEVRELTARLSGPR